MPPSLGSRPTNANNFMSSTSCDRHGDLFRPQSKTFKFVPKIQNSVTRSSKLRNRKTLVQLQESSTNSTSKIFGNVPVNLQKRLYRCLRSWLPRNPPKLVNALRAFQNSITATKKWSRCWIMNDRAHTSTWWTKQPAITTYICCNYKNNIYCNYASSWIMTAVTQNLSIYRKSKTCYWKI